MGLLSLPRFETRGALLPGVKLGDPALVEMWGGSANSHSAQYVTPETALSISTVMACVARKSKTLAMLPLNVMRRLPDGGHEVATKHRLQKQIHQQPNRWQTSFQWRLWSHPCVMLRGNSYSKIVPSPGRGLNELVPMDPDRVWPFVITREATTYYLYDNSPCPPAGSKLYYQYFPLNGMMEILTADDVLHIRGITSNGIVGKNVIKIMRESIGLAMATEEQGARLFSNGAQIGKILKHPNTMSDVLFNRMQKWLKDTQGVHNAHKTLILEEGMDITQTTLTMEDAQFLQTRQFQVEDIASFLDVPLMLINRSGDKNMTFASAEQLVLIFVTQMMQPDIRNYEEQLSSSLLYPWEQDEFYIEFDLDGIMRGDSKARGELYRALFGVASITPDEIRAKEHMSPLSDGKGKKIYILGQMVPLEDAGIRMRANVVPVGEKEAPAGTAGGGGV